MKALKAITNRVNERTAKQQQTQRKLERELDVLDALDSMDDDDDDDDEDLDKRRQELEAMQVNKGRGERVPRHLLTRGCTRGMSA